MRLLYYNKSDNKKILRMYDMKNRKKLSEQEKMSDLIVLSLQILGDDPYEKLVEMCNPITYGTIKRYFFPDYEREDFIQEARTVLVKSLQDWRIDKGMPFMQYYHMQLNNHLNMLVRKNHAQKRIVNLQTSSLDNLIEVAGIHVQGISNSSTDPEDQAIARETMENYLSDLSELELKVLKMNLQGISYKDICEELDLTLDQTRSALYRSRVKLARFVNGK